MKRALASGVFAASAIVFIACQRSSPATDAMTSPTSSGLAPPSATASASASTSAASTRPALGLTNVFPGVLAIENTGDVPLHLATAPRIEGVDSSGVFTKVDGLDLEGLPEKGMRLVEHCEDKPGTCVDLAAHATLHPVRWSGMSCSAQCNGTCRANAFLGGRFRWVVSLCDGGEVAGPVFDLPPDPGELGRFGVTENLVSATVARLDAQPPHWDGTKVGSPGKLVDMPIRPGSERLIDPADLATLVALLRTPKSFDDQIAKRCVMNGFVGFRFTRRPPSTLPTHEETAELFIDFSCNALFITYNGEGTKPRQVFATYFDPSRAAFITLTKKLLPGDSEIAKLK